MIRIRISMLVILTTSMLLVPSPSDAQQNKTPPGLAKKGGVPPGQAKRGCLPPGLAKRLGPKAPCRVYAAVDPERSDRVWLLVGNEWVLHANLEVDARNELRVALALEVPLPPPPPVPLPSLQGKLTVMLFGN